MAAIKKIPPKKPHFFKPILPGFKNGLKIPVGFLKYLKGHENLHAIVRRGGKKWVVKVNGRRMEDGWTEFAEEYDLQLGDMLVFRHEGNMEFDVSIFGSSCCEREYAAYTQEDENEEEETPKKFDLEEKTKANIRTPDMAFPNAEAATKDMHLSHSHLICTIKPYCLTKYFLRIPTQFALDNRLNNRKCTIIMRDERRSWTCSLYTSGRYTYIGRGWHEFCTDKRLKEGDRIMFEIVSNGETPIFKFHDLRGNPSHHPGVKEKNNLNAKRISDEEKPKANIKASDKTFPNVEAANKDMHLTHSHFICTIKPYCLSRNFVALPRQFVLKNRLNNRKCMIIIRDERRSRTFSLYTSSDITYIGNGWREFCIEKCLKEGDRVMFEIVSNGKTPIFKFQDLRGSPSLHPEVKKKNYLDAKRISEKEKPSPSIKLSNKASSHAEATTLDKLPFGQSHFISTIRPYCLSKGFLFLPQEFAKANGLTNKKCDLIIRDGRQSSWKLKLSSSRRPRVYIIGDGLRKFFIDNCLKEGDRVMFEVVTNGEIPIWKFQVVPNGGTPIREFQDIRKKPSNMSPLNAQVSASTSADDYDLPYFISTIKPYCTNKSILYLPLDFVKSNGLMDRKCELILKNEEDRSWSVWLGREGRHFGIVSGWSKFRTANGLQVGDVYKFELVKNGEVPIAHFHCKQIF